MIDVTLCEQHTKMKKKKINRASGACQTKDLTFMSPDCQERRKKAGLEKHSVK